MTTRRRPDPSKPRVRKAKAKPAPTPEPQPSAPAPRRLKPSERRRLLTTAMVLGPSLSSPRQQPTSTPTVEEQG